VNLLEPVTLGRGAQAPSRVMFGPHETNLGRRRAFSDRHVAYYRRRAAGGAGLVVTETASVHPSDWPYERAPLAAESAEGWASIARACHDEGRWRWPRSGTPAARAPAPTTSSRCSPRHGCPR
jgi:2,4-dienoyl-CoA reductase (NADPH2)